MKMDVTFKLNKKKIPQQPHLKEMIHFSQNQLSREICPTFSPKLRMPQNMDAVIQSGTLIIQFLIWESVCHALSSVSSDAPKCSPEPHMRSFSVESSLKIKTCHRIWFL